VKPCKPGDLRGPTFQFNPGGGLQITNATLKAMLETAYDVRDFQIAGGPAWFDSQRYDIAAKSASPDSVSATRQKLQTLLAERFQLKVHHETKDLPVYILALGKNGPKLKTSADENPKTGIRTSCGQMVGTAASMHNLTVMLARQLGRPVLDTTGLTGKYDFDFDWTPDTGPCPTVTDGPSLFTALQEKLGLKLEATKRPTEVIVVDHAEKADEN
jgi:uncharacterized protein (TIGR03435 family)